MTPYSLAECYHVLEELAPSIFMVKLWEDSMNKEFSVIACGDGR